MFSLVQSDDDTIRVLQLYLYFDLPGSQDIINSTTNGFVYFSDLCNSLSTEITTGNGVLQYEKMALLHWLTGVSYIEYGKDVDAQKLMVTKFISNISSSAGIDIQRIIELASELQLYIPQVSHKHIHNTHRRLRDNEGKIPSIHRLSYSADV